MSDSRPIAVVTGATRGIGREIALALAGDGAWIAGFGLADPAAAEVDAALRGLGVEARLRDGDVRDATAVEEFASEVEAEWGRIDVWVNNAGVVFVEDFLAMDDADWRRVLDVNLHGCYHGCRAAARRMVRDGSGSIVNLSSVTATQPPAAMTAYIASKAAIAGLTRALAVELAPHGVRVNSVAPGPVLTDMTRDAFAGEVGSDYRRRVPVGRIAEPSEIAAAVAFLASPAAGYVNGHELLVDGGLKVNGSVGGGRS
jgi:3-oxoacyl-[acyl-carrier protein] reductase